MKPSVAFIAITSILILLSIFQITLIVGLPLGNASWGGQNEVLPVGLRIASAASIVIYVAMIWIARRRIVDPHTKGYRICAWVIAIYFFINIFMNLLSASNWERLWAPACLILSWAFFSLARRRKS
ncbi:MAG: hypothetical protein AB1746_13230 [Candidatus Zixiibacteriota bacterium]